MNLNIILIGIIVGIANYISRFSPFLFLTAKQKIVGTHRHLWLSIAMGSIGISAICAMLMVATLPPLLAQPHKIYAMACGFAVLTVIYFFSKKIVPATLCAALCYGLVYTYF